MALEHSYQSDRTNFQFDFHLSGIVVAGYGVASGRSPNSPYPKGTIAMQSPLFQDLGLDLDGYFMGTINLSIEPRRFKILRPDYCFQDLAWAAGFPPETFSFCRCQLKNLNAWIYYPHPETKIGHFQSNSLLEIIAPSIPNLSYGDRLQLSISSQQLKIS